MNRVVFAEALRRHFRNPAYWAFVATLSFFAMFEGAMNSDAGIWRMLMYLGIFFIGAQLIGPEFSSGTLQMILARPVNRSEYLVARFAGIVVVAWTATAIPFALDVLGRATVFDAPADYAPVITSTINSAIQTVLICALLAFFGSLSRSYFNAGLYVVSNIVVGLIDRSASAMKAGSGPFTSEVVTRFLNRYPIVTTSLTAFHNNVFPSAPDTLQIPWTMMVVCNASIALLAASHFFRNREVPYGAD